MSAYNRIIMSSIRHVGHCWRSRDELIRDVLLWTPTHGRAKAGRPARTYIQQLCEDTGCCPEDLPRVMNDREEWRDRVSISVLPARHDDDDDFHIILIASVNRIIYDFFRKSTVSLMSRRFLSFSPYFSLSIYPSHSLSLSLPPPSLSLQSLKMTLG